MLCMKHPSNDHHFENKRKPFGFSVATLYKTKHWNYRRSRLVAEILTIELAWSEDQSIEFSYLRDTKVRRIL